MLQLRDGRSRSPCGARASGGLVTVLCLRKNKRCDCVRSYGSNMEDYHYEHNTVIGLMLDLQEQASIDITVVEGLSSHVVIVQMPSRSSQRETGYRLPRVLTRIRSAALLSIKKIVS